MRMLLSAITVALFATTAAYAQAGQDDTRPMSNDQSSMSKQQSKKFEKLDRDKNGLVSKSEAQKDDTLTAQFASVDQDSDGNVSRTEYLAATQTQPPTRDMPTRDTQPQPPRDYGRPPPQ
jgi:lipopolysaccharide export LptBFGC system permease protein LptF